MIKIYDVKAFLCTPAALQGIRPSTMYTWTDNTDKNFKPNKVNMTAFKNLTL